MHRVYDISKRFSIISELRRISEYRHTDISYDASHIYDMTQPTYPSDSKANFNFVRIANRSVKKIFELKKKDL